MFQAVDPLNLIGILKPVCCILHLPYFYPGRMVNPQKAMRPVPCVTPGMRREGFP